MCNFLIHATIQGECGPLTMVDGDLFGSGGQTSKLHAFTAPQIQLWLVILLAVGR